ncbi:OmpH family outer membrane protein [Rurimicrobium arvi]|uniref:Periplasmic chaperone for outer membrane proteins Skp n=1 Tax=Rurimicrobium arvi TaxID=2049916 RepID=A0ABP8MUM2_9BACT
MTNRFGGMLRTLALAGVVLYGTSCNNHQPAAPAAGAAGAGGGARIAYVNIDTLQAHYDFMKSESAALEKQQQDAEAEFQRAAQQFQSEAAAFQQKAQAGGYSEAEGRSAQQRLAQMQQSLETRRTQMTEELQKKQIAFGERLQKTIDAYLAEYNKDNKYDFILSYSKAGPVLYANKAMDITEEVTKGLNQFKPVETAADTSSKK